MSKRPLCRCCVRFVLGVAAGMFCGWMRAAAFVAAIGTIACGMMAAKGSAIPDSSLPSGARDGWNKSSPARAKRYALIALGVFLLGMYRGHQASEMRRVWERELTGAQEAEVRGVLTKKEQKNQQIHYYLNVTSLCADGVAIPCSTVILYPTSDDIPIGTDIWAKGIVCDRRQARNEGNYDQTGADYSQQIACRIERMQWLSCRPPKCLWRQRLYEIRLRLREVYEANLPGEEAGVLAAMTLGDKTELTDEVKDLYRKSGLSHVLAVSGLHISVLCMGLYRFLRGRGIGFGMCGMISGSAAVVFGWFCGNSVGTGRAVGMFLIYLAAQWMGRAYDSVTALGVMGVWFLWERPLLLSNSSFIFSFGAVVGVVVFAVPLQKAVQQRGEHAKSGLRRVGVNAAGALAMSAGIWIFTLPIVASYYYEIPPYAILLNLCLLPFLPALLSFGLFGGVFGMAAGVPAVGGVFAALARRLAGFCFLPCHLLLYGYEMAADLTGRLPFSSVIVGCPRAWQMLCYYAVLYLCANFFKRHGEEAEEPPLAAARPQGSAAQRRGFRGKGAAMAVALFLNVLLLCRNEKGFEIDVLDVGQGDGIFVQSPEGVTFFVDGGSTDESEVGRYRILPFLKYKGVRSVDYWFVSHTDADHINGLTECMESGYDIGTVVFARYMERDAAYERIVRLASEHHTAVAHMQVGDRCGTGGLTWTCVGPNALTDMADANASSLILQLECGEFRGLFTGDIGAAQEEALARVGNLSEVDFLKAAHHGSDGSNSQSLLDACRPAFAAISCGADNRYGHPGEETLRRLEDGGIRWRCTAQTGRIRIRMDKGRLLVDGYAEQGGRE